MPTMQAPQRRSIFEEIPTILNRRSAIPDIPGQGDEADQSFRGAFPGLANWQPYATKEPDYTPQEINEEAYYRVNNKLSRGLQDKWNNLIRDSRLHDEFLHGIPFNSYKQRMRPGHPYQIVRPHVYSQSPEDGTRGGGGNLGRDTYYDETFSRWARTPLGQKFAERYLRDTEAAPEDFINIPDLVEKIAAQQAKRQELVAQDYRENINRLGGARRRAIEADPHLARRQALADQLGVDLQGLAGELRAPLNIEDDPSYRFSVREAQRGLDNAYGAAGMLQSGARGKALVNLARDLASQQYGAAHGRRLADVNARSGLLRGAYDARSGSLGDLSRLYQQGVSEEYQQAQEAEATYRQDVLNAITQYGQGAGGALEHIADDQQALLDKRERDRLEALNIALGQRGIDAQARAAQRQQRASKYSAILGAIGNIGGALAGRPYGTQQQA